MRPLWSQDQGSASVEELLVQYQSKPVLRLHRGGTKKPVANQAWWIFPSRDQELSVSESKENFKRNADSSFFSGAIFFSPRDVNRPHGGTLQGIMTSQGFSFPPPPPPPPVPQASSANPPAPHGQHWNARGAGRGRGRGQGNRGRGGNHASNGNRQQYQSQNNHNSHNNTPGYNYAANYGYPSQPVSATSYMAPPFPHTQSNFQHPQSTPSYQPRQTFQTAGSAAYQPLPHYNVTPSLTPSASYPPQSTQPYPSNDLHHASPNNPIVMGAVPWSPDAPHAAPAPYGGATPNHVQGHGHGHGGHGRGSWPSHPPGNHNNHGHKPRPPHKRDHSAAFNKPQSTAPRTPAAPAVPSFGNPLPCKPPPAADANANAARQPKKRKRKHNQLGLTPKTEDHESSEDEEDVDEESNLAQGRGGSESAPLQFSYKGRTATLQSSADIAAWIAERRKKFPTAERIEERKKVAQEAKDARDAARREKMNDRTKMNGKTAAGAGAGGNNKDNKEKTKGTQRSTSDNPNADPALDAAMKAQRKADKIRRNLDREQKRFAKAEAEAEAARLKVAALQKQLGSDQKPMQKDVGGNEAATDDHVLAEPNIALVPETTTAEVPDAMTIDTTDKPLEPGALTASAKPVPAETDRATIDVADHVNGTMDHLPEAEASRHASDDWTSSSGSESGLDSDSDSGGGSDSDSDDSDGDSAPEQASSRRQGPEKVLPPPREGKKQLCRHFARSGKCNRGGQCSFSHDVSARKVKPEKKEKGRKGLLSAVSNSNSGCMSIPGPPAGVPLYTTNGILMHTVYSYWIGKKKTRIGGQWKSLPGWEKMVCWKSRKVQPLPLGPSRQKPRNRKRSTKLSSRDIRVIDGLRCA